MKSFLRPLVLFGFLAASGAWADPSMVGYGNSGLTYSTSNSGVVSERMRITPAGNVGIGTTTPGNAVHISSSTGLRLSGLYGRLILEPSNFGTMSLWNIDNSNGVLRFYTEPYAASGIPGGGTVRMVIVSPSGNVGIAKGSPLAKLDVLGTISASDAIQVGSSSLNCVSGISGSIRYSQSTSSVEYCNGSAWTSMGPSSTSPISFRVNKGGTDQTVTTSTDTLLTWGTVEFDTNNNFSSNRYTPSLPGKYLFTGSLRCNSATSCVVAVYKNGAVVARSVGRNGTSTNIEPAVTTVLDMNGTTDYVELWGFNGGGTVIVGTVGFASFSGAMLSPQSGSGGGGASPAGSAGDIQFNDGSALAADTGQLFWDESNNRLGLGRNNPTFMLDISDSAGIGAGLRVTGGASGGALATFTRNVGANTNVVINGSGASAQMQMSSANATYTIGTLNAMDFRIASGSAVGTNDVLTIKPTGFVGIGTTAPAQELDVAGDINLSGATSRTISFGTTGVAAPAAGSAGMKVQLYGASPGNMTTADYALGIESGNMWINSGGGFKWYTTAVERMAMDASGRVAIGQATSPNVQLIVVSDTTNPTVARHGIYSQVVQRSSSTGTYYSSGNTATMVPILDTGVTNNGWAMGQYVTNLRSSTLDSGTLAAMHGNYIAYGHNAGGATKATTSAYGVFVQPYATVGTITNLYGVYLSPVTTGGTVTNNYAIYQADPSATNYFAGPVSVNGNAVNGLVTLGPQTLPAATTYDFTGIPSTAKRVTVLFQGVSLNNVSQPRIQLGTSGGIVTSGYVGSTGYRAAEAALSAGFDVPSAFNNAANAFSGMLTLMLTGSNNWVGSFTFSTGVPCYGSGYIVLSGALDRVRITSVSGSNTFDAGSVTVMYE